VTQRKAEADRSKRRASTSRRRPHLVGVRLSADEWDTLLRAEWVTGKSRPALLRDAFLASAQAQDEERG
jgi:hypothetical protein